MLMSGSNTGKSGYLAKRVMPGDEFEHPHYRLMALPTYGGTVPGWVVFGDRLSAHQKSSGSMPSGQKAWAKRLDRGFCVVPDHRIMRLTCTPEERKIFRRELREHNERGEGAGYAYIGRRQRGGDGEEA